jgi:predicted RNA-binding Zn-ribbon protein involved in translation (DUF1610 family)
MIRPEKEYRRELSAVRKALNSSGIVRADLRSMVAKLQSSGSDVKFSTQHPDLWRKCQNAWNSPEWNAFASLVFGAVARKHLTAQAAAKDQKECSSYSAQQNAFILFNILLVNPLKHKLSGPCSRCGDYFIAKRERSRKTLRTYCSRECGWRFTAIKFAEDQRKDAKEDKLERAKAAVDALPKHQQGKDWKRHVASSTGIDLRFLTRATKPGGGLKAPKGAP